MSDLTPQPSIGNTLSEARIIAVLVIDDAELAVPVAKSLLNGGVTAMELTLRTPAALAAAAAIRAACPEMAVGIGTILFPDQVQAAVASGASFGVSPGVNPLIIRQAKKSGLAFAPGIMTPTDIDMAVQEGCRLLKFFPAESSGGLAHLKNIAAPFVHLGVQFIPLGGISLSNMMRYFASDLIAAVGGSWLAPRELIQQKKWKQIESNAKEAISALNP